MDTISYEIRETFVLAVAALYFRYITKDNFPNLFKLNLLKVVCLTKSKKKTRSVRNFLMMLFHLKHYLPIRTACILFNLERSRYEEIINSEIQSFLFTYQDDYFQLERRMFGNSTPEFPNSFMIVDSTEVLIQAFKKKSFSGKKNNFTLKYQILVGVLTGEILHVHGPEHGSVHDTTIWKNSNVPAFLAQENETVLGDKGYVGCSGVLHPHKKATHPIFNDRIPFNQAQIDHNHNISKYRILIENVNSWIKNWSILSTVYRGNLESHRDIFLTCCILTTMTSEDFKF
jgi:hypothetical protein